MFAAAECKTEGGGTHLDTSLLRAIYNLLHYLCSENLKERKGKRSNYNFNKDRYVAWIQTRVERKIKTKTKEKQPRQKSPHNQVKAEPCSLAVEEFLCLAGGLGFYLLLFCNQNWARIVKLLIRMKGIWFFGLQHFAGAQCFKISFSSLKTKFKDADKPSYISSHGKGFASGVGAIFPN